MYDLRTRVHAFLLGDHLISDELSHNDRSAISKLIMKKWYWSCSRKQYIVLSVQQGYYMPYLQGQKFDQVVIMGQCKTYTKHKKQFYLINLRHPTSLTQLVKHKTVDWVIESRCMQGTPNYSDIMVAEMVADLAFIIRVSYLCLIQAEKTNMVLEVLS